MNKSDWAKLETRKKKLEGMKPREEEFIITGKEMAKISLEMYQRWEEQMKLPLYRFYSFREWLEVLINTTFPHPKKEEDNE